MHFPRRGQTCSGLTEAVGSGGQSIPGTSCSLCQDVSPALTQQSRMEPTCLTHISVEE